MAAAAIRTARSAAIETNFRCNQNCKYCTGRRAEDDRAFIAPASVRARIDAAMTAGAREIVFTGGEPTMRGDLESLVAHAVSAGAERVALETNASLVDDTRARSLALAGVTLARVNLSGWSDALDLVTRDEGGFHRTWAGILALSRAGLEVEILAALVRSTRAGLVELPARLAASDLPRPISAMEVAVPVESPDESELLSFDQVVETLRALDRTARAAAIPLRLHPAFGVPPCVFSSHEAARLASLYALTPGALGEKAHAKVAACGACSVDDRCPGFPTAYLAKRDLPPLHPVKDDKTRRRLTLVAPLKEQIARELVTPSLTRGDDGAPLVDAIVRINFHCNQACSFCFVSTHLPPATGSAIESAILAAGERGERIVISGGEPTLNPRVVEYVQLARRVSRQGVSIQTNAVRLDDVALVRALDEAGFDEAFVSLHGATAAVSDAVTQAPGTFTRTLVGLDNLVRETQARVGVNFVICSLNHHELVDAVRLVADRWPRAYFNVSFVAASTDLVPKDRALIPRYSDVMPNLAAAVREARARGVRVSGFDSMCGLPLCLVPAELDEAALVDVPPGFDAGEFLKTATCADCRYASRCWGLRRGYAALYGTSELRAVPQSGAT